MTVPVAWQYGGTILVTPGALPIADAMLLAGNTDGSTYFATPWQMDWSGVPTTDPQVKGWLYQDGSGHLTVSAGVNPYSQALDYSDPRNSMYLVLCLGG
jgi:hypothetical protein